MRRNNKVANKLVLFSLTNAKWQTPTQSVHSSSPVHSQSCRSHLDLNLLLLVYRCAPCFYSRPPSSTSSHHFLGLRPDVSSPYVKISVPFKPASRRFRASHDQDILSADWWHRPFLHFTLDLSAHAFRSHRLGPQTVHKRRLRAPLFKTQIPSFVAWFACRRR